MSFENLNAENRGQNNVIPPTIRRTHCSHCKEEGHNIRTCGHARLVRVNSRVNRRITNDLIREFEFECARRVQYGELDAFLENEIDTEPNLIRSFAIKKCGANNMTTRLDIIRLVNNYINRIYVYGARNIYDAFIGHTAFEEEEVEEVTDVAIRAMEFALRRDMVMFMAAQVLTNFIQEGIEEENRKFKIISTVNNNENEDINKLCECNICYEEKEVKNFVKLNCNHEFCKDCVIGTMKSNRTNNLCCALCRTEVKSIELRTNVVRDELSELIE